MSRAPNANASERALLEAALQGGFDMAFARDLKPEEFYDARHQAIWRAIRWGWEQGHQLDHLLIHDRLQATGDLDSAGGWQHLLLELRDGFPSYPDLPGHVETIRDMACRRAIQARAVAAAQAVHDLNTPAVRIAQDASGDLASLGLASTTATTTMRDAMLELGQRMVGAREGKHVQYLPTGIDLWDEILGGLERGRLILLGAYPSVGKSALSATIAINRATMGASVAYFSLEDEKVWLAERYMARKTNIPVRRLLEPSALGDYAIDKLEHAEKLANEWCDRLFIDDRAALSPHQLCAKARQLVLQQGVDTIIVDNASEVDLDDVQDARHDLKTGRMVRMLRNVAKECMVPVLLLVHFKRPKGQTREEPRFIRPTSDLWKNAGAFEEAARVAVAGWLDQSLPDHVIWTVLKQTKGKKDVDFALKMHEPSGLFYSDGGVRSPGVKGYSEPTEEAA